MGFQAKIKTENWPEIPKVFTDILMEFSITGSNLSTTKIEKALELSIEKLCSAYKMLNKTAKITYTYKCIDRVN